MAQREQVRDFQMQPQVPPMLLMQLMKVMNHFNSNGYLSSQHIIPFSVLGEVPQNRHFICNLRVNIRYLKYHGLTHKGLVKATRSSSCPTNASKEEYETLQQQWIHLLAVYHCISHDDRVSKVQYFVCNLRVNHNRNDNV